MPYLLLVIGLIIGLFALYRFFINANVHQVKALFMTAGFVILGVALLILALTGRLPAALAIVAALIPIGIGYLREKYKKNRDSVIDVTPIAEEDEDESDDKS